MSDAVADDCACMTSPLVLPAGMAHLALGTDPICVQFCHCSVTRSKLCMSVDTETCWSTAKGCTPPNTNSRSLQQGHGARVNKTRGNACGGLLADWLAGDTAWQQQADTGLQACLRSESALAQTPDEVLQGGSPVDADGGVLCKVPAIAVIVRWQMLLQAGRGV